jgi:hypothetical protein
LGEYVAGKTRKGYALYGLHVWLAKVMKRQHQWLGALCYLPHEKTVKTLKTKFSLYSKCTNARGTLGLELGNFSEWRKLDKNSVWWKEEWQQRRDLETTASRKVLSPEGWVKDPRSKSQQAVARCRPLRNLPECANFWAKHVDYDGKSRGSK